MPEFFPDQVHVGQDLGGREFAIPAEDVARYREGTANDAAAASPAPPLLYHSEVYRRLDWYLANIIGNLHARQEWELFAPLRVGDVVRSHSTVVERYRKRNRDYVVNEVLFTDADGRWLQRSRTHQSFLAASVVGPRFPSVRISSHFSSRHSPPVRVILTRMPTSPHGSKTKPVIVS